MKPDHVKLSPTAEGSGNIIGRKLNRDGIVVVVKEQAVEHFRETCGMGALAHRGPECSGRP